MTISNSLVVLFIIMGAGIAVFIGWAMTHRFQGANGPRDDTETAGKEFSQVQYMRDLRMRHVEDLAAMMGGRRVLVRCLKRMG